MVVLKFLVDPSRCLKCGGCEVACKRENDIPEDEFRIKVVTVMEGRLGRERSVSMSCFHCSSPPCMEACPRNAIWKQPNGVIRVDKDRCIGCGYCLYACPFGAPQFSKSGVFGSKGAMDKCNFCQKDSGTVDTLPGEEWTERMNNGIIPACAATCPTGARIAGDLTDLTRIKRERTATTTPTSPTVYDVGGR